MHYQVIADGVESILSGAGAVEVTSVLCIDKNHCDVAWQPELRLFEELDHICVLDDILACDWVSCFSQVIRHESGHFRSTLWLLQLGEPSNVCRKSFQIGDAINCSAEPLWGIA